MPPEVTSLHEAQTQEQMNSRIRRTLVVFAIGTAIAVALIVAALIWRDASHLNNPNELPSQIIVVGVTLLWGCVLVFFWGMKLTPLLRYRRFLRELDEGLSRYEEGVVVRIDEDISIRDELPFYGFLLNIGNLAEPEDERLFYWDAALGKPALAEGDRVIVHAHGNDLIGIGKAEER